MRAIILRLDAPIVSFGAPSIDQNGVVQQFPGLSMIVGLVANALGWRHQDTVRLGRLQDRLRFAARIDRPGEPIVDYQTVALGTAWMDPYRSGWTTRGLIARRGGASSEGTHQRYRHYRADSLHTVAFCLDGDEPPSLDDMASALREPARPLFVGRKCCLPAAQLFAGIVEAPSLLQALASVPRASRAKSGPLLACCFESEDPSAFVGGSRVTAVTDERDWSNRIHVGRRLMREGELNPPEARHA
jgi:CRISPR system Cascade subunit CasD